MRAPSGKRVVDVDVAYKRAQWATLFVFGRRVHVHGDGRNEYAPDSEAEEVYEFVDDKVRSDWIEQLTISTRVNSALSLRAMDPAGGICITQGCLSGDTHGLESIESTAAAESNTINRLCLWAPSRSST
jgi:hypothetical protein